MRSFCVFILLLAGAGLWAGPYNDPGVFGYLGEDGAYVHPLSDPNAQVNPIFRGWATGVAAYQPGSSIALNQWGFPNRALGPATGDSADTVSLGDLSSTEILSGRAPGSITLTFGEPNDVTAAVRNGKGYDFAVFENGFLSMETTPNGTSAGEMYAELGYVEVSSDGQRFARFPSVSLTTNTGFYLTIDITDVFGLAGKHPNSYDACMGTPFDLESLRAHPLAVSGAVDLDNIRYIRIVDIPGSGDFLDEAHRGGFADPNSWPAWRAYGQDHPIRDSWLTYGSGGFDLDAVGLLKEQQYAADINLDGIVDLKDFAILSTAMQSRFGQANYCLRCDLSEPPDLVVDTADVAVLAEQWMQREAWYAKE